MVVLRFYFWCSIIVGICSCSEKHEIDNLIYVESKFIKVDFIKNRIITSYAGQEAVQNIRFTGQEKQLLAESYEKNRINLFKGFHDYPKCPWTMPSFEDRILVYDKQQIHAEIYYNANPGCEVSRKSISEKQKRIEDFLKCLKTILAQKQEYLNAKKILEKMKKDNPHVFFI